MFMILISAVLSASAGLCLKRASHGADLWQLVTSPWAWTAMTAYGLSFITYAITLRHLPVSIAQPAITALAIAMTAVAGFVLLDESLSLLRVLGLVLVVIGVLLISAPPTALK